MPKDQKQSKLTTLLLKIPRNTPVTTEAAQTLLASLVQMNYVTGFQKLLGTKPLSFALELVMENQQIKFLITCSPELVPFVETQIRSNYPLAIVEKTKDPLEPFVDKPESLEIVSLSLTGGNYYPIATSQYFKDIDPLSSILSVLSKSEPNQFILIQHALESTNQRWQTKGHEYSEKGSKKADGTYTARTDSNIIKEKITYPGFKVTTRLAFNLTKTRTELESAYKVFSRPDGNSFTAIGPNRFNRKKFSRGLFNRNVTTNQILNIAEIATLWHLPGEKIQTPSIVWGISVLSEPPENLPVAADISEAEKKNTNFFAKTWFKNQEQTFGIKNLDRLRHVWAVGKTGTGKSTLIANMAIDDARKDRGFGIIDPHGDLCDDVLNYIPANRINDTIYFNPADKDFPIHLNPLEVTNKEEAELVVSGLMAIFTKVWANVWSARMEYILRNSFLTLAEIPDATLADVLKLLANQSYRNKVIKEVKDPAIVHFWKEEFDKMPEKLQKEAISPIQNKVGQFVTSPLIRRIISNPKSSISIEDIMDDGKILLTNLSQGRLGEDNAQLLGAMIITKFQVSAMRRVDKASEDRRPFYLYVDEFQNFATSSFIKILSEARKYKLALMLANQYMAQIPPDVQKAILGNAGTLITFSAGAEDAAVLHKEFAEVFSQNDLVNLQNYQIALKLMVDSHYTRPFLAKTLPLPTNRNENKDKVIRVSRERWGKKAKDDDSVIPTIPQITESQPSKDESKPRETTPLSDPNHPLNQSQPAGQTAAENNSLSLTPPPTTPANDKETETGETERVKELEKALDDLIKEESPQSAPPSGTVFENKK
jgi:hypothetical protein